MGRWAFASTAACTYCRACGSTSAPAARTVSFGHRGLWYTVGSGGRRTATLGWPGTGLRYTSITGGGRPAPGRAGGAERALGAAVAGRHRPGAAGAGELTGEIFELSSSA